MSSYEDRKNARRLRYEERAKKAKAKSDAAYRRVKQIGSLIPFGQPILVGHHSERGHRATLRRMDRLRTKCVEESQKAAHYERKAAAVGTGGISSDDPAAIEKLRAQLADLEKMQETMKAANKLAKKGDREGLQALLGIDAGKAEKMLAGDWAGRVGYPPFMLSNNNANIRRIKERIASLEAHSQRKDVEEVFAGYTYREDTVENRVMFSFDRKPPEQVRVVLKTHGFRWSPMRGAWVRQLNNAGINAAQHVKKRLHSWEAES